MTIPALAPSITGRKIEPLRSGLGLPAEPDIEPGTEQLAAGLSTELASIASAIVCHGQLLIEECSPLSPDAASHRDHLVRDMQRLRWLSRKVHASTIAQHGGGECTAQVAAVLNDLRRRMLDFGLGPMRVEVEVYDPLPDAACSPTSLRRALQAAVEVLLSKESDPTGLFLRANVTNKTPPTIRIEATLEVAELLHGEAQRNEEQPETTRAMEQLSTRAANNWLAPYDVTFSFDGTPGVFGRSTIEIPAHSLETPDSNPTTIPRPFTTAETDAPPQTGTSTINTAAGLLTPANPPSAEPASPRSLNAVETPQSLTSSDTFARREPSPSSPTPSSPTPSNPAARIPPSDPRAESIPAPPVTGRSDEPPVTPSDTRPRPRPGSRHPYGGILLVTEDASIRAMLMADLAKTGRNVVPCLDRASARALLAAAGERFELLVLEAGHPTGPGLDLALEGLNSDPDRRIILLGAPPELEGGDHRLKAVPRPFDVKDVRGAVHALLD